MITWRDVRPDRLSSEHGSVSSGQSSRLRVCLLHSHEHNGSVTEASKQQLAALMFTDIAGSVALQNKLGSADYTRFIRRHDEVFKECLGHAGSGEILNKTGDGFLGKFNTPTEAVNTALRLQAALHDEECEGEALRLCIGLDLSALAVSMEKSL